MLQSMVREIMSTKTVMLLATIEITLSFNEKNLFCKRYVNFVTFSGNLLLDKKN